MSQKIYDELVAAGAPRLPEGYHYFISHGALKISIRNSTGVEVFSSADWPYKVSGLTATAIRCAATFKEWQTELSYGKYMGVHP